ncbi:MAG: HAD family hydrolase [Clostridiales bacterium]|nr:HAD family hydrolase [Clostridiales bacterium]
MKQPRLILFTDIGDTIIDEGTEIRDAEGTVVHADCIPGACQTYLRIREAGFPVVMVADGTVQSFANTMRENGLDSVFAARIISEAVGEEKPSARMFEAAMAALGLTEEDKGRILMIGNNVARDIAGANRFGIRSVLLTWSTRRSFEPSSPDEIPTYRIAKPEELIPLLARLEEEYDTEMHENSPT